MEIVPVLQRAWRSQGDLVPGDQESSFNIFWGGFWRGNCNESKYGPQPCADSPLTYSPRTLRPVYFLLDTNSRNKICSIIYNSTSEGQLRFPRTFRNVEKEKSYGNQIFGV